MKEHLWLVVQIVAMLVMWAIVLGMFASIIIALLGGTWWRGWMW